VAHAEVNGRRPSPVGTVQVGALPVVPRRSREERLVTGLDRLQEHLIFIGLLRFSR